MGNNYSCILVFLTKSTKSVYRKNWQLGDKAEFYVGVIIDKATIQSFNSNTGETEMEEIKMGYLLCV